MPEMDGLEASRQIQERLPPEQRPVIVALSADTLKVGSRGTGACRAGDKTCRRVVVASSSVYCLTRGLPAPPVHYRPLH